MKKSLLLILVIVFVSGCANQDGFNQDGFDFGTKKTATSGNGVNVAFVDRMPPAEVNEGSPFRIGLMLTNFGSNVNAEVCVRDMKSSAYGGITNDKDCRQILLESAEEQFDKNGKFIGVMPKDYKEYFPADGYYNGYTDISQDEESTIIVEVNYDYTTEAIATVCLSGSFEGTRCPASANFGESQLGLRNTNSPVIIDNLKIEVDNIGIGQSKIIATVSISDKTKSSKKKLYLDNFNIGFRELSSKFNCMPLDKGQIVLEEGNKVVKCYSDVNLGEGDNNYQLEISFNYKYILEKEQKIRVKNIEAVGDR